MGLLASKANLLKADLFIVQTSVKADLFNGRPSSRQTCFKANLGQCRTSQDGPSQGRTFSRRTFSRRTPTQPCPHLLIGRLTHSIAATEQVRLRRGRPLVLRNDCPHGAHPIVLPKSKSQPTPAQTRQRTTQTNMPNALCGYLRVYLFKVKFKDGKFDGSF